MCCDHIALIRVGVMWPFEGMPEWLRYISAALPATYPAEAMRAIMGRGMYSIVLLILNLPSCHDPSIRMGPGTVHL